MIKALWFFVKVGVFVGSAIWLLSQPGQMDLGFLNYDVKIKTGLFILILMGLLIIASILLRMINAIFSVPKIINDYREEGRQKSGYRALTRGLVAIAAGDVAKATQYSKQTQKLLKDQTGLPLLLEAQAARLRGEDTIAKRQFEALVKNPDTAFLGIRGLIRSAMDRNDKAGALEHALKAYKLYPNQKWILKMVYALETQNHHWEEMLKIGKKAEKIGAITNEKFISDQVAIHLMRHDYYQDKKDEDAALKELKSAYKLDKNFIPTITRYASYFISHKKNNKAMKIVQDTWKVNPHPDLADIWNKLSPKIGKDLNNKKIEWFEKLVALNPTSAEGYIAAARASIDMNLWGEAKAYLMAAEKIYPTAKLFHLRAMVEKNISHNEDGVEEILNKAKRALPDKRWTCVETGMIYEDWSAIAIPHESFNTIIWDVPCARIVRDDSLVMFETTTPALLIDPAA